jgi:glycosyltransferase involved in cell wall biosynthesis
MAESGARRGPGREAGRKAVRKAKIERPFVAIIPAHNEEGRVGKVLRGVAPFVDRIVAIDDGSTDGTYWEIIGSKSGKVAALRLPTNCGKGVALRTGFDYARKFLKAKTIVTIDSDGQHLPAEIPKLAGKLVESGADIVVGCRMERRGMPMVKRLGNSAIRTAARLLFGISVPDSQSGFRVFGRRAIERLEWGSAGYSVETEELVNAKKLGLSVETGEITTIYNDGYKGTSILNGVRILTDMMKWRVLGW